jgi:hypothetical protein
MCIKENNMLNRIGKIPCQEGDLLRGELGVITPCSVTIGYPILSIEYAFTVWRRRSTEK